MKKFTYYFLIFLSISSIFPDSYHNLNGLVGERAAGLGGAYTAISDDPSGTFYNPAGIAFAYDNFISISANTYTETEKRYQNVFGPGQDYVRKSSGFNPNFIGTVKSFTDKLKMGFSIISPVSESFDQADRFYYPTTRSSLSSYRIDYTENNDLFQIGGTLGYILSDKLSIGGSLFYFNDSTKIISNQIVEGQDGSFNHISLEDRRKTLGIIPALGVQYMPTEKVSLGLAIKRTVPLSGIRAVSGFTSAEDTTTYSETTSFLNSHNRSASINNNQIFVGAPESGDVPEVNEIRTGVAFFANKLSLFSFDLIYTEGFTKKLSRNTVELRSSSLTIQDSTDPYLQREPTLNYAFGFEYYILDSLAMRVGAYTNFSNNEKIDWTTAAVDLYLRETGRNSVSLGSNVTYLPDAIQAKVRFEDVDTQGYTLGFGWETSRSSISLTYIYEYGKGIAQIDSSQLPQSLIYRNSSIYLVASSHN
ncbi:MAG: hypothetical protein AAF518_02380 [Spirochaetota bacterium]